MKTLSVIIINKNREFSLDWCIRNIIPQLAENDEFIIIDDDSDDGSLEIIEKYKDRFTTIINFSSEGNRSKVRNRAAKEATGDVLVFVDGDVIICSNALEKVRAIHEDDNIVGLNGAVYGNSHTIDQLELITNYSIEEFNSEVENSFEFLEKFHDICDYRSIRPDLVNNAKRNWCNYFTSFATATHDAFCKCGGFEEAFSKWGVEDMEFAYRLNKLGDIIFDPEIVSYHHPHEKNAFKNALNNLENLYLMLKRNPTLEFELICAATVQFPQEFLEAVEKMCVYIAEHNEIEERVKLKKNEIALYFPSTQHCKGYIEYSINGTTNSLELCGFSLPFVDCAFDTVYISGAYSLMQSSFLAMTIQECLRVGGKVLISKHSSKAPAYFDPNFLGDFTFLYGEVCGVVHSIVWFERRDYSEDYYEIKWKDDAAVYLSRHIKSI